MDANQFDHVAKAVGAGTSRRRLVAGLLGATLAGALGRATGSAKGTRQPHRATAPQGGTPQGNDTSHGDAHKPGGATCKNGTQCQSGNCCEVSGRKSGTCSAELHNPTKTYTFKATDNGNECSLILTLTGFAGCTTYGVDVRDRFNTINGGYLSPTDWSGSLQIDLTPIMGPMLKVYDGFQAEIDIRFDGSLGVPERWEQVIC